MKIIHGRNFQYTPNRSYNAGVVDYVDFVNIKNLNINVFSEFICTFGYDFDLVHCYSSMYLVPLDVGLMPLNHPTILMLLH